MTKIKQIQEAIEVLRKNGFSARVENSKAILEFDVSSKKGKELVGELEREIDQEICCINMERGR